MRTVFYLFFLLLFGCEKSDMVEPIEDESWAGTWYFTKMRVDDSLMNVTPPEYNTIWDSMIFTIPEADSGAIGGHTFKNTGGWSFEKFQNNEVAFGPFGGTRRGEDIFGMTLSLKIRSIVMYSLNNDELIFSDSTSAQIFFLNRVVE